MGSGLLKTLGSLLGIAYEIIRAADDDDPDRVQDVLPVDFRSEIARKHAELRAARKFRSQR